MHIYICPESAGAAQCAVQLCIDNAASWGLIPSVISQHNSQAGAAREGILSRVQGDVFADFISFGRLKYYFQTIHFTNRNFVTWDKLVKIQTGIGKNSQR